jgi:6-phosphogluconolactonase (cycloisomerase 2 family)
MNIQNRLLRNIANAAAILTFFVCSSYAQSTPHYLIANNDNSQGNSASFYSVDTDGSLTEAAVVNTGGTGLDGIGAAVTRRVNVVSSSTQSCAFVSNGGSATIAAILIPNLTLVGTFNGGRGDSSAGGNIGLANDGKFLYASFIGSKTIATYQILSGCNLRFIRDVSAAGLTGAEMLDMAAHGNILVASFNDGSIGSFSIAHGAPKSNRDLQISTAHMQDRNPIGGVDISADGHFALLGNVFNPLVEVSDISSGKLAPTVVYRNIGTGSDSNSLWLAPNGTTLYLGNFFSGQVTAASFDPTTGVVSGGCTSNFLAGNNFTSQLATATQQGTGSPLYVAEADRNIGIVDVNLGSGTCSLTEQLESPVNDPNTDTLESITAFPPRPF